jgi:hypothetical protein
MTNFRLSDTHHIALLEYHDERVHTELDRKLDGTSIQVVFFFFFVFILIFLLKIAYK